MTMEGLLIFDQQGDVIFSRLNDGMRRKIHDMAVQQELIAIDSPLDNSVHPDILVQLFSPLIASQRIMFCQFDNSYTSLECEDNQNFVFEEFLGYLLLKIGNQTVQRLQRTVGVSLSLIKRICGPDLGLLKSNSKKTEIVETLIDTWAELYDSDQAMLVEGVDHLVVNHDLKQIALKTLELATENLKQDPHSQRSHGCLFVRNKLLSIFSSKQAQEIAPSDILFLSMFQQSLPKITSDEQPVQSHLLLLQGQINGPFAGCIPHIVHSIRLANNVVLMLLVEYGSLQVASGLYDIFFALHKTRMLQMQNDVESLKPAFEKLDGYVKSELDALKKAKYNSQDVDAIVRKFIGKWDMLRRKYVELFRNSDKDLVVTIESNLPGLMDALRDLFRITCVECGILGNGLQRVTEIATLVEGQLLEFGESLRPNDRRLCSISTYMEEFPGLVHFMHIDRSSGRVIAPKTTENTLVSKEKIWSMVEFSRSYLQRGHMSVMWKDTAFSYSYFLWFEDHCGNALKPKELPNSTQLSSIRPQVVPGVIAGEFYQWLIETCFPKTAKIKCFELYCVHLGLATTSCVLEHNRRLAATILEATGVPSGGLDGIF